MPPAVARWSDFLRKHYKTNVFQQKKKPELLVVCEQIRPNMSRTAARAYVCSMTCSPRFPKAAKQPKQRDHSEIHLFARSNGFSMILLVHVVLKPTNLNSFHLLSLRFFIFLKSWFSTKSIACGLLQIQVKLFFFKYQKTSVKQSEMYDSDPLLKLL